MRNVTRREFLSGGKAKQPERGVGSTSGEEAESPLAETVVDRRNLLKFLGVLGATLAGGIGSTAAEASMSLRHPRREETKEETKPEASYLETAEDQLLNTLTIVLSSAVTTYIADSKGIQREFVTDEMVVDAMRDKKFESFLKYVVGSPQLSELARFGISDIFINRDDQAIKWNLGIAVAGAQTAYHLHLDATQESPSRFLNAIPVGQFLGGIFFWHLMRKRGFSHALLAHTEHNAIAYAVAQILLKKYPSPEQKPKIGEVLDLFGGIREDVLKNL